MFNQPKLSSFWISAMVAITFRVVAEYTPRIIADILFYSSILFAGVAIGYLYQWIRHNEVSYQKMMIDAKNTTEMVRMAEALGHLTAEQIELIRENIPFMALLAGEPGPSYALHLGDLYIPRSFLVEFIKKGTLTDLCPIRDYSEGSKDREWGQAITKHLINQGYARYVGGPYPAAWVDRLGAIKALGLEGMVE